VALSVIQRRSILSICDAELGVRKVCANGAARVDSEPHQSRDSVKCKSQKMLERQDLQECNITLKIRDLRVLEVQLPPPGTTPRSRSGRWFQTYWNLINSLAGPFPEIAL